MLDPFEFRARVTGRRSTSTPAIVWYRSGCCRRRLLRAFLTPNGWHVLGESFRLHPQEWADRTGVEIEPHFSGETEISDLRRVSGFDSLLPLRATEWGTELFEVGCDHAITDAEVGWLVEDTERYKGQSGVSRPVDRTIAR